MSDAPPRGHVVSVDMTRNRNASNHPLCLSNHGTDALTPPTLPAGRFGTR